MLDWRLIFQLIFPGYNGGGYHSNSGYYSGGGGINLSIKFYLNKTKIGWFCNLNPCLINMLDWRLTFQLIFPGYNGGGYHGNSGYSSGGGGRNLWHKL